ncbi:MAG: class I SAM-dependent methyltransferase [Verrucomicrobia bacterium]|nr:class I SAM-dependent methyltransferase [Verrucomicrobiota bacterium]MBU1735252.1 class I SAM-dependent methyltransferase [Verrucomicrobiota bacterium]MBU1857610.1 class I SAM-dependent methyltransferase [Verrucomicrobiota bacterium]
MQEKSDFVKSYNRLAHNLRKQHDQNQAMSLGVGGNFDTVGILERELLIQHGLKPNDYLIDVGCGSGRLSKPLAQYLSGKYLGVDVVADFIQHARKITDRPDWKFEVTKGINIPEKDGQADMVCFFSVFTHLLHEQSYWYLHEAKRVLKQNGKIFFSFLEFKIPDQWVVFESTFQKAYESHPLIIFMSRDAIEAWAYHLELEIASIIDGNIPHIPIPHPLKFENGSVVEKTAKLGPIGQSVCILAKK